MKADEKFFKSSVAIIHRVFSDIYNLVLRKNSNPNGGTIPPALQWTNSWECGWR